MTRDELEYAISQYIDGVLPPLERSALEEQLAGDPEARAILAEYRKLDATLKASMPLPSIAWDRLTAEIQDSIAAEPATPFVRLTEAVVARWPEWPPYGGLFDEVIPHLTVVESDTAPLGEVETAVRLSLPFKARATRLELWRQDAAGRWHPHWLFPLGGDP